MFFLFMDVPPKRAEVFWEVVNKKDYLLYIKQTELIGKGVLLPNRSWFKFFFSFSPNPVLQLYGLRGQDLFFVFL